MIFPKAKENNKEKTEVIKPSNCLLVLTWVKKLVPEKKVKKTVNILLT